MLLFETKSKTCMILAHKRITALNFGTGVAFVFGGSGGSAAVSSQFHIVLHKSNCCAEFTFGFKIWHIRLSPLLIISIKNIYFLSMFFFG